MKTSIPLKKFKNWNQGKTSSCVGHACANALLVGSNVSIDPIELWKAARKQLGRVNNPDSKEDDGLRMPEIREELRSRGYKCTNLARNLDTIALWISRGVPVVLSVKTPYISPTHDDGWHAVTVYAVEGDIVRFVNSWKPTWGPFNNNTGYFQWRKDMIKWMFVVASPEVYKKFL